VADVLKTYGDIAEAGYQDSLTRAKELQAAVDAFLAAPSEDMLAKAKEAWFAARVPYQQTEAYRFGNKIVDDWEGKVNSWPLDEGLIDYTGGEYGTESAENALYVANVIANPSIKVGGETIDASQITKELISGKLHEGGGIEANVATGYHAVEFLLWGQDLNGTGPGSGARPATDYDAKACTGGNCDRRAAYLKAATDLLVDDLTWMAAQWAPGGDARKALGDGSDDRGLVAVFTGLGSLSYGELAGERMKLGLLVHDPEEEHDCFSDNTHHSHYYDAMGLRNVYLGTYTRIDGSVVSGPSPSDLVKAKDAVIDERLRKALDTTIERMTAIVDRAKAVEAYDQMIGEGNAEGNAAVDAAVTALLGQTKEIQRAISALDLKTVAIEGSDSLDDPSKVLQ
jgi:putative iron-regulated protein